MTERYWIPSNDFIERTRLFKWMQKLGFNDYDSFYRRSIDEPAWFWREVEKELEIPWYQAYSQVIDESRGIEWTKWFVDGKLNAMDLSINKWAKHPTMKEKEALVWEGEDGEGKRYTFKELSGEIQKVAFGLKRLNLKRGDVVAIYMPMLPETVIAMMAVSQIGAIFTPIFSGYGMEAIATRIAASKAKLVITADGFKRKGNSVLMKEELDHALVSCPLVERVVVVGRLGLPRKEEKREYKWEDLYSVDPTLSPEMMQSEDPLMLIYTSGTTGQPKGTVHSHSGFPIKAAFDAGIGMDLRQEDTLFWYTDMGWMMGPFLVYGGLINGATIVLYEGSPDFPKPDRLWTLVSRYQVTHLGISPTLIRTLMKYGEKGLPANELPSLRVIASTGEPWNDDSWLWLFTEVGKKRVPIFNYSGGTEIAGGILGNILLRPITPSTFNAALPGMAAYVYDDAGKPVQNKVGELVLTRPWVGMTNGFWEQPKRYIETYWSRWPSTWVHGDWVIVDESGYFKITGRSDDIINMAGKRMGPSEMETVLASHDLVHEAGVIGVPDVQKGDAAVCFVVLQKKIHETIELEQTLLEYVGSKMGKALKPKKIHFIRELPKTKNGKVMRRMLKNAYLHYPLGDVSAIENKTILNKIAELKE
ncbi:AMP-binding protein [Halalkalibacter alkalisediminis]|uniref:acetate--CoA ligase n=1 Tax=Halalkalibacter alkalisediminis TaxID=935616 RepID=A0ABV6NLY6_9BACI|nr:AMP-binding protein [Halalkalibacter alkalisediminis]